LSAPVLNFSGNEGKIFTFKPAQKSAGSAINLQSFSKSPINHLDMSFSIWKYTYSSWISAASKSTK
jgi:hypothetical protein